MLFVVSRPVSETGYGIKSRNWKSRTTVSFCLGPESSKNFSRSDQIRRGLTSIPGILRCDSLVFNSDPQKLILSVLRKYWTRKQSWASGTQIPT
jgi:hypothetical protein